MVTTVRPRTIVTIVMRNSLATDSAAGEKSNEWLMFNVVKATACRTSDRSINVLDDSVLMIIYYSPCCIPRTAGKTDRVKP